MSLRSLCDQTADVQRKATAAASASNKGGHVATYTTAYDDLAVSRPQQPSGATRKEADRRELEISHCFYTPTVVTLQAGDRVVYGGSNYQVQWFSDEGGQQRVFKIVTLKIN